MVNFNFQNNVYSFDDKNTIWTTPIGQKPKPLIANVSFINGRLGALEMLKGPVQQHDLAKYKKELERHKSFLDALKKYCLKTTTFLDKVTFGYTKRKIVDKIGEVQKRIETVETRLKDQKVAEPPMPTRKAPAPPKKTEPQKKVTMAPSVATGPSATKVSKASESLAKSIAEDSPILSQTPDDFFKNYFLTPKRREEYLAALEKKDLKFLKKLGEKLTSRKSPLTSGLYFDQTPAGGKFGRKLFGLIHEGRTAPTETSTETLKVSKLTTQKKKIDTTKVEVKVRQSKATPASPASKQKKLQSPELEEFSKKVDQWIQDFQKEQQSFPPSSTSGKSVSKPPVRETPSRQPFSEGNNLQTGRSPSKSSSPEEDFPDAF